MKKYLTLSILPLSAIAGMAIAFLIAGWTPANAQAPDNIAADGEIHIETVRAEGAQIYECKVTAAGLAWQFREPVATLFKNGAVVGNHFPGPEWHFTDGAIIAAKAVVRANGATAADLPLLKLEVTKRTGSGLNLEVTTIQRINTKGGVTEGPCPAAGKLISVPYSADYAFYRKLDGWSLTTH